jgi:hypothetical protein
VVIITLQVLGQTVLGFKVSIAQILITVVLCGLIDAAVTLNRRGVLALPASGMLTGNSIAFILRASGTRHGDWWSVHGIQWFVLAALLSLLSKYLLRKNGRHLFNPSNLGIVWTLLLAGLGRVFPQYLWWGPLRAPVVAALLVILVGGAWVLKAVRMYPMVVAFLLTLGVGVGVFAATGHSFVAVWHSGPVGGLSYWADIALSPELLVFAFFMMSDPQTAPKSAQARIWFGVLTALIAVGLLSFQPTEFGIKLAILTSLTVTCALAPVMEGLATLTASMRHSSRRPLWVRRPSTLLQPVILAVIIIVLAAPVDTAVIAGNKQVILIERGLSGSHNPQ